MGKCVKYTFDVATGDSSLVKMGHMRIHVRPQTITDGSVQQKISFANAKSAYASVIKVVGEGYFAESFAGLSDPAQRLTEITIASSGVYKDLWFSVGTYDIDVSNKDYIWGLKMSDSGLSMSVKPVFTMDFADLKYDSFLTRIILFGDSDVNIADINGKSMVTVWFNSINAKGELSAIATATLAAVTSIELLGTQCSGSIVNLAPATACIYITVASSGGITGALEDFADAQLLAGRTSGTLQVDVNDKVTVGGQTFADGTRKTITYSNGSYTIS